MERATFSIKSSNFEWIDGRSDDPDDLCSHGKVIVQIGDEELAYFCCTSAAAMRMLRTLTQDHEIMDTLCGEQMLPCCGFEMYADETGQNVSISGCPNGVDFAVHHQDGDLILTTEDGKKFAVSMEDYRREVLKFAHQVESFYTQCSVKNQSQDEYAWNGYQAFWKEWKRRMEAESEHK